VNPWSNPLSKYSEFSTENGCCVCPEALLTTGINDTQSLTDQSRIPLPDGNTATGDNSGVVSRHVTEYEQYSASPDSTDKSVLECDSHSRPSSINPDVSQAGDAGTLVETEASNIASMRQFSLPEPMDSPMLTKAKPSSSLHGQLSIRSLQRRLAGKAGKDAIDHIHNVLRFSTSNSWRSSIASFASSWKSRGSSLLNRQSATDDIGTSTEPKLSSYEQMSWDELVDETKLAPPAQFRLIHPEISLNLRPCCGAIDNLDEISSCSTCGFSSAHNNGRHCVEILNQGLGTYVFSCFMGSIDRFGNTPLHFAAASADITTTALKTIIMGGVNINARNTSGENFMHVLNVAGLGDITEHLDLLGFLNDTDFRFSDRDIHGRTIAHRYFEGHKPWEISMDNLTEIFRLLRVDISAVNNLGYDFGLSELMSNRRPAHLENSIDRLHRLLSRHRNPAYQNVDFRAWFLSALNRRIHGPMGVELLGLEEWLRAVRNESLCKWVDINGDTPLTTLVKYYPEIGGEEIMFRVMIRCLVSDGCDINARDRRGYTALAIATRRGLRPIVSCLLNYGALVNTRSYHGTSTISHAATCLRRAQKLRDEKLYGKIVSCISLIADKGAKTEPSVYEEFGVL
jgi:ankyrin repeat protein